MARLIVTSLTGHPNARLFISHGGLLGIQEAVYHGVPLLGLPMMNDQPNNLAKIEREGMGLALFWPDLSEDVLYESINKIISDPR
jgi:glucuronosyltransferase